VIDPEVSWQAVDRRLAQEQDPARRHLLELVRDHIRSEVRGELDAVMATLSATPAYHFRGQGEDRGPKGRDAVRAYYVQLMAAGMHRFEFDVRRVVVDDRTVVTEGRLRQALPAAAFGPDVLVDGDGAPLDPSAAYLVESELVVVWPSSEDGKLVGEDVWFGSGPFLPLARADALQQA
jgi:hypothetical protein